MEHATLLDFSFVILPPENRADKFFLPHVRYFLRRRSLYPAELRRLVHNGASGLEACKQFLIIAVQTLCGKGQIDRTNGS